MRNLAHGGPGNAELCTDLAQGQALGVQVGCPLAVHGVTVTAVPKDVVGRPSYRLRRIGPGGFAGP